MSISAKLIFLCGKMAAGKSTLARDLAQRENAVLLVQDEFLDRLFPGEITDIPGFVKCSSRLKNALGPHVCALLSKGISVVLDFPGNTKAQRAWFRELFERANAEHELHFVDASDALCKSQLLLIGLTPNGTTCRRSWGRGRLRRGRAGSGRPPGEKFVNRSPMVSFV